ncbi:MAG: acyl-CoA dehydrogenase family protein [Salinigranum sp.]
MFDTVPEFLLPEKTRRIRNEIREFVEEDVDPLDLNEWEWREDPHERVPWQVVDAAAERGLKDLTVPEEYGGEDASPLTLVVAAEEMAAGEMGIGVIFDQIWKIARIIDKMADEDIRERFFSEFVDDPRHLLAITLTEPAHGSDYITDYEGFQFDTVAEKDGDEWVINGEKCYISNGADAKTYVVFAQTDPDAPAQSGTTAFLVPRETEGLEVTHVWEKISQRMINNATVEYHDVRIPEENVLGEVHRGKQRTAEVLKESNLEAGATTLGTARRAFEEAWDYSYERTQGGQPIMNHQVISHDFAEMAMQLQAARSLLWDAARAAEAQEDYWYEYSPMGKVFAADTAFDVATRALEKFGAQGIMLENERPMQKYLRDCLSFLHSDGAQEAHKESLISTMRERYEAEER